MIWTAIYFLYFEDISNENAGAGYAALISSPFVWLLGKYWNRIRIEIDPNTQQEVAYKHNHSLFWILIQYWGGIMLVGGIILLIVD